MSGPSLIRHLLAIVAPRCTICHGPATRFEGTQYSQESPLALKRYACDAHLGGKGWTDLPGAAAVREATEILAAEKK